MMNTDKVITGPFNLGNPVEFTIRELAETIVNVIGGPSKLVFKPLPQDDPKQRQPDIALAKKHLEWEPQTNLVEGLKRTIDYFRALIHP
jgi:UDP-glucuronate decarboxylase